MCWFLPKWSEFHPVLLQRKFSSVGLRVSLTLAESSHSTVRLVIVNAPFFQMTNREIFWKMPKAVYTKEANLGLRGFGPLDLFVILFIYLPTFPLRPSQQLLIRNGNQRLYHWWSAGPSSWDETRVVTWHSTLRKYPHLAKCSAMVVLEFLILHEKRDHTVLFHTGPPNC